MTNSSIHLDCRTAPCLLDFGSIFALAPDVRGPQSNFRFPRQTRQINPHGVDEIQKLDRGWQIRTWCGHPPVPGLGALKSENLAEFRKSHSIFKTAGSFHLLPSQPSSSTLSSIVLLTHPSNRRVYFITLSVYFDSSAQKQLFLHQRVRKSKKFLSEQVA